MVLFSIAEPFSIGKQTPIWHEKRSTLWPENKFFKSDMNALTLLSICDTDINVKIKLKASLKIQILTSPPITSLCWALEPLKSCGSIL